MFYDLFLSLQGGIALKLILKPQNLQEVCRRFWPPRISRVLIYDFILIFNSLNFL